VIDCLDFYYDTWHFLKRLQRRRQRAITVGAGLLILDELGCECVRGEIKGTRGCLFMAKVHHNVRMVQPIGFAGFQSFVGFLHLRQREGLVNVNFDLATLHHCKAIRSAMACCCFSRVVMRPNKV